MQSVPVSPYGDENIEYSLDELIGMYTEEGKSYKEALELAKPLQKFMHSDNKKQQYSWSKSYWERSSIFDRNEKDEN